MRAWLQQVSDRLADVQRERRIRDLGRAALTAEGDNRRALFNSLRIEALARSPAQVERMERAKGLR